MRRRTFLKQSGALAGGLALGPKPLSMSVFGDAGTLTAAAREQFGSERVVTHGGDGIPSWYVSVDDADAMESLSDWVDHDDDREIIREFAWDAMVVKAPAADIGIRWVFGVSQIWGGLQSESWVETIDRNLRVDYPEPPGQLLEQADWDLDLGYPELIGMRARGSTPPSSSGLAFDQDAEATVMDDSRPAVGADDLDLDASDLLTAVVDTGLSEHWLWEDDDGTSRVSDASTDFTGGTDETDQTVADDGRDAVDDDNGHGDHVTATIGANPGDSDAEHTGLSPEVGLLVCKALDADGEGRTGDIAKAIELAADEGADTICLSLGSPIWSEQIHDALEYAVDAGSVPVAAVGNSRPTTIWTASPADSEYAIGVTATTADADPADRKLAYFANTGPDPGTTDHSGGVTAGATPDLAAPGMAKTMRTPDGEVTMSGTSMAAPHVVGGLNLLLASEGGMEFEEARDRLADHADPLPNVADTEVEFGGLNVKRAIEEDDPDESQSEAMTDEAEVRGLANRRLSDTHGGRLTRFFA